MAAVGRQMRGLSYGLSFARVIDMSLEDSTPLSHAHPRDYAAVMGVFSAALALHARSSASRDRVSPDTAFDACSLALATFSVADAIAHERIAHFIRAPFVTDTPDDHGGHAKGEGMRYAIGELLTCSRCVGSWSALGLAGLTVLSPAAGRAVIGVFAAAGANDLLQTAFKVTTSAANRLAAAA